MRAVWKHWEGERASIASRDRTGGKEKGNSSDRFNADGTRLAGRLRHGKMALCGGGRKLVEEEREREREKVAQAASHAITCVSEGTLSTKVNRNQEHMRV